MLLYYRTVSLTDFKSDGDKLGHKYSQPPQDKTRTTSSTIKTSDVGGDNFTHKQPTSLKSTSQLRRSTQPVFGDKVFADESQNKVNSYHKLIVSLPSPLGHSNVQTRYVATYLTLL